jgi:hypothetical protein
VTRGPFWGRPAEKRFDDSRATKRRTSNRILRRSPQLPQSLPRRLLGREPHHQPVLPEKPAHLHPSSAKLRQQGPYELYRSIAVQDTPWPLVVRSARRSLGRHLNLDLEGRRGKARPSRTPPLPSRADLVDCPPQSVKRLELIPKVLPPLAVQLVAPLLRTSIWKTSILL